MKSMIKERLMKGMISLKLVIMVLRMAPLVEVFLLHPLAQLNLLVFSLPNTFQQIYKFSLRIPKFHFFSFKDFLASSFYQRQVDRCGWIS